MHFRFHVRFEAVEFEVRGLIVADEGDVGLGGDFGFEADGPVASIYEQAASAFG